MQKTIELSMNNLLKLHDNIEDKNNLIKWIRISSIKNSDDFYDSLYHMIIRIKNKKNIKFTELSKYFSKKLNTNITPTMLWGYRGGEFYGNKRGIPIKLLILLIKEYCLLNNKSIEEESNTILRLADIVIIRGGLKTKLIKEIDENLCYLVGIIAGDGCCPKSFSNKNKTYIDYRVTISKENNNNMRKIARKFNILFGIKPKLIQIKKDNIWCISLKSKYVVRLLSKIFEIPIGKKSLTVRMPSIIKNSIKNNINSFIRGVIDSDGCIYIQKKKYPKITLRMRSEQMIKDIAQSLKNQNYHVNEFSYMGISFNRKYKVKFYGLEMYNKEVERYVKEIGFLNPHKIKIVEKFFQAPSFSLKLGRSCLGYVSSHIPQ